MGKSCVAVNCTNRWKKDCKEITFHRFPFSNKEILNKWINAVGRVNWQPTKSSVLCSQHFTDDSYYMKIGAGYHLLKVDAVPSIFTYPKYRLKSVKQKKLLRRFSHPASKKGYKKLACNREKPMVQCDLGKAEGNEEYKKQNSNEATPETSSTLKPLVIHVNSSTELDNKSSTSTITICSPSDFTTVPVSEHSYAVTESPTKLQRQLHLAMDRIAFIGKKLKMTEQKCRRLTRKVQTLKLAIFYLERKNHLTTEDLKVLRTAFHDTPHEL